MLTGMEQDKPTLVPAVLNDLMDVDGTPAAGDTLTFDGIWQPSSALPVNGPAIEVWRLTTAAGTPPTTPIINTSMHQGSNQGPPLAASAAYTGWDATNAELGTIGQNTVAQWWTPNEPGRYRLYYRHNILLTGGSPSNIQHLAYAIVDPIYADVAGPEAQPLAVNVNGGTYSFLQQSMTAEFDCPQELLDTPYGSVAIPHYTISGTWASFTMSGAQQLLTVMRLTPQRDIPIWEHL